MNNQTLREQLQEGWPSTKRWTAFLQGELPKGARPYRYTHRYYAERAKLRPPRNVGHTVSAFKGWLYRLHPQTGRYRRGLEVGKEVERAVRDEERTRAKAARMLPAPTRPGWQQIHVDTLDGNAPSRRAGALRVCGEAVYGVPDLVYQERKTRHVVIVERKATPWEIPIDGWPDLRAQLWAYSQIDDWADAPKITLVGEVWADDSARPRRRAVLRWTTEDKRFMSQNAELFAIYADHCARLSPG